jgi:exopolysaccharide biosynthesis protein
MSALSYYPAMRLLAILLALVSQPYVGITYIDRTETLPRPVHMHIVQVDLAAPGIRFKLSPPAGSRETVRQTTLDYLAQEGAQVAINAHFFLPFPSTDREAWLVGIASSEGRVYSAFETPEQSFALVRNAPGLNIDRENHAAIVHRDRPEGVTLWTTVSGSAQIVTEGVKTLPVYLDSQHANAALTPGGPGNFSNEKSWYDVTAARTAIGLSRDGRTLTLFTVDVRGDSEGMRVGEVADVLMQDYGVWNALNLDGGGSTSMAMEDPTTHNRSIVNVSSDNPAGRSVGSSLAVFARPIPKP